MSAARLIGKDLRTPQRREMPVGSDHSASADITADLLMAAGWIATYERGDHPEEYDDDPPDEAEGHLYPRFPSARLRHPVRVRARGR